MLLHSYFQVSPEMFDRVQILRCLGSVLRVVVLLEGELLPQSEVLSTLEQVFIKELCTLRSSSFPRPSFTSILTGLKKKSPQHYAATTMLHRKAGARFPPDVTLGIQAKEFNLGFIRPDNRVSHGLRVM